MATCAEKQAWLAAAEAAWHTLRTGGAVASVRYADKETTFTKGDATGLARYIMELRRQVEACTGVTDAGLRHIIHVIPAP